MLRIVTCNVNGLRSAVIKGILPWLTAIAPDILCLQEVKAQEADLPAALRSTGPGSSTGHATDHAAGHATDHAAGHAVYHFAEKKGYSGTALIAKTAPRTVRTGFGNAEFDREGRYVEAEFDHVTVVSAYFPSGSSSEERQAAKFRFLDAFLPHLQALRARGREVVLCGDVNIAHREIDIKNWRSNQKNSGFLPEERAWLTHLFDQEGWVDVFRKLDPRAEQYTWWSNRGQARQNNVGWRIDYQIATAGIAATAKSASIHIADRFSDHAPLIVDYDFPL